MELVTKSQKAFTSELRPLSDAEIDHVGGGAAGAVAFVLIVAVGAYLVNRYIEENYK